MHTPAFPELETPDHYARGGVQFSYPSDWELKETITEEDGVEVRHVNVGRKGAGGAFLRVFSPPPPDLDFDGFIETFTEKVKERVPNEVSLEGVTQGTVAQSVAGEERHGVRKEFHLDFLFQQFSLLLDFHRIDVEDRSVFLVTVLADTNASALVPAMDLIRNSLKVR